MENEVNQDNSQHRRPGPVGFSSSGPKRNEVPAVPVDSSKTATPADSEHMNEPTSVFRNSEVSRETSSVARTTTETPTSSKELHKVSPGKKMAIWMTIGLLTFVAGIVLFTPVLTVVGLAICLAVLSSRRRDKTEDRISQEFFK